MCRVPQAQSNEGLISRRELKLKSSKSWSVDGMEDAARSGMDEGREGCGFACTADSLADDFRGAGAAYFSACHSQTRDT